jgi:hypothetical protein
MTPDGIGGTSPAPHTPPCFGSLYSEDDARRLAAEHGWVVSGAGRLLPSTDEFSIPLLPPGRL